MTILATGSTGTIGSRIVERLAAEGASVKALVRAGKHTQFPEGVQLVTGDMTDVQSMRAALKGVDTLFLLNAVAPDELTQALVTLDLAVEAGIKRIVYFSVFNSALFADVPHFTAKYAVEQAIDARAIPATVLRPAYFFQNDLNLKQAILDHGVYPMPIGSVGVAMVDVGDIVKIAASELLRRERAPGPLPRTVIEVVGPDTLSGGDLATIWSRETGRTVTYAGDDLDAFEGRMSQFAPGWQARDMRMMFRSIHRYGMTPAGEAREVLAGIVGGPGKSYADFAHETVVSWQNDGALTA